MSFKPVLSPPVASLIFDMTMFMPMARSTSLYSSLTFVTAVYALGIHTHTTKESSMAVNNAMIYG